MAVVLHILAQRLARDNLWPVLVFLLALAVLASFRALGNRIAKHSKTSHHLHALNRQPHEPVSHGRP